MATSHVDAELIRALGGPAKVAQELRLGKYGTQRVFNWMRRGIPADVKLARPDLFLPGWKPPKPTKAQPAAPQLAEAGHG